MFLYEKFIFYFFSVENEGHCDFVKLREMLIRTNMEDMREKTHTKHYETYRKKRLEQMGFSDVDAENKPLSFQNAFEAKRNNHMQELQQKEEEMRQMFVVRVREKEAELKEAEKEVIFFFIGEGEGKDLKVNHVLFFDFLK